jgi:transposase InsO family protein
MHLHPSRSDEKLGLPRSRRESFVGETSRQPVRQPESESFMKTLKHEEVYRSQPADLADARRQVGSFIESVYNRKRLHSALGFRSPSSSNISGQLAARGLSAEDRGKIPRTTGAASEQFERDEQHEFS